MIQTMNPPEIGKKEKYNDPYRYTSGYVPEPEPLPKEKNPIPNPASDNLEMQKSLLGWWTFDLLESGWSYTDKGRQDPS